MLKFTILLFLFFVHSFTVLANSSITLAQVFTIQSEALREQRDYSVYLPPSYQSDEARHFPVIYVLDGDEHRLKAIAGIVEGLSTDTLEKQVQEAIIVAIPNSKNAIRERDFTPTNVNWEFNGQVLEKFENIGNAANYLEFFQRELLPHINKTYRTTQQSLLIGESFGGLFAAYALLSQPRVFTDYLIIDATYLWHNNYLNRYLQNNKLKLGNSEIHAYFTFANNTGFW